MKQLLAGLIFGVCAFVALSGVSQNSGSPLLERIAEQIVECVRSR
jgi:hypothetical protein